jgi:hypothetical protein
VACCEHTQSAQSLLLLLPPLLLLLLLLLPPPLLRLLLLHCLFELCRHLALPPFAAAVAAAESGHST